MKSSKSRYDWPQNATLMQASLSAAIGSLPPNKIGQFFIAYLMLPYDVKYGPDNGLSSHVPIFNFGATMVLDAVVYKSAPPVAMAVRIPNLENRACLISLKCMTKEPGELIQSLIVISESVMPLDFSEIDRRVSAWPRQQTNTATKLISMVLAKKETTIPAIEGLKMALEEINGIVGCLIDTLSHTLLMIVE